MTDKTQYCAVSWHIMGVSSPPLMLMFAVCACKSTTKLPQFNLFLVRLQYC